MDIDIDTKHVIAYDPYRQCTLTNNNEDPLISASNKRGFTILKTDHQKKDGFNPTIYYDYAETNRQNIVQDYISHEGHIFIYTEPVENIKDMQTIEQFEIDYRPKFS